MHLRRLRCQTRQWQIVVRVGRFRYGQSGCWIGVWDWSRARRRCGEQSGWISVWGWGSVGQQQRGKRYALRWCGEAGDGEFGAGSLDERRLFVEFERKGGSE